MEIIVPLLVLLLQLGLIFFCYLEKTSSLKFRLHHKNQYERKDG